MSRTTAFEWLRADARADARWLASQILGQYRVFFEFEPALITKLQDLEADDCSPRSLEMLRRQLYRYEAIRDIAIIEDGRATCTAINGALLRPIELRQASARFDTGSEIRFQAWPAGPAETAFSARFGRHELIFRKSGFDTDAPDWLSFSILFLDDNAAPIRIVDPGAMLSSDNLRTLILNQHRADVSGEITQCLPHVPLCVNVQVDAPAVFKQRRGLVFAAMALGGFGAGSFVAFFALAAFYVHNRQTPESRAALCLARGAYEFWYQPIVDMRSGRTVGAEALLRPKSPYRNLTIEKIIEIAERSGRTHKIALKAATSSLDALEPAFRRDPDFFVSINISPIDLDDDRLFYSIKQALRAANREPKRIDLEITERTPYANTAMASCVKRLRAEGFRVSIDDFGSGHANLNRIGVLGADIVKVDRQLTAAAEAGTVQEMVLDHVLTMLRNMQIQIVVEGIETARQEAFFLARGVELAQGWRYAPALSAAEFVTRLGYESQAVPSEARSLEPLAPSPAKT